VGAAFLVVLGAAELWARVGRAHPEHTRKLVHVAGGLVCLSFPFVFASPWTVLALAAVMTALLAAGSHGGWLRSLHSISRRSRGSEYYPLAVLLVFLLSLGRPWLYVASLLVLVVADACAALVGVRWGRVRYRVEDESKSLEGSLAFGAVAFVALLAPLLAMTDLPPAVAIAASLLVAIVVTGFEAVCLTGSDNLFVPLAACVILGMITTKPLPEIVYQNVSAVTILVVIGVLAWRSRTFNVGGALVAGLFTYGAWSLGSERWAAPALLALGAYLAACATVPGVVPLRTAVMFRALLPSQWLLVTAVMLDLQGRLYAPFVATLAAVAALAVLKLRKSAQAPLPPDAPPPSTDEMWCARDMLAVVAAAVLTLAGTLALNP
jgi:phytol kinase